MLKDKYDVFKSQLQTIQVMASNKENDYQQIYKAWEQLQKDLLNNMNVSLLAVTHFYNQNGSQEWKLYDEGSVITPSGRIDLTKADQNIMTLSVSQIFARHLSGLFNSLKSEKPSEEQLDKIRSSIQINSIGKDPTFKNAIWSAQEQKTVKYRGQVADAFLQHVGAYHAQYLKTSDNIKLKNFSTSAFREEGPEAWIDRLIESKNRTGWWTGGDLILLDNKGNVVFNIQLKTSAKEGASIGNLALVEFNKHIKKITDLFQNNNYEAIANQFYNMVKTSGIMEKINDNIQNTAEDIKNKIKLPLTK